MAKRSTKQSSNGHIPNVATINVRLFMKTGEFHNLRIEAGLLEDIISDYSEGLILHIVDYTGNQLWTKSENVDFIAAGVFD